MAVSAPRKGRQGGFPRSHKSKYREDLHDSFDSSWEANLARYLNFLLQEEEIAGWARKGASFLFPALKQDDDTTKGNRHLEADFQVFFWRDPTKCDGLLRGILAEIEQHKPSLLQPYHGIVPIILEVKGRFDHGAGLLHLLTDSVIREELASDTASAVKLIRMKHKYPDRIVYIFGDQEYARLRQEFKAQCPLWEGS